MDWQDRYLDPDTRFYILGLAPNAARLSHPAGAECLPDWLLSRDPEAIYQKGGKITMSQAIKKRYDFVILFDV